MFKVGSKKKYKTSVAELAELNHFKLQRVFNALYYGGTGILAIGLLPFPLPSPISRQQVVSLSQARPSSLLTGDEGWGKEPNHMMARKPGPL